MAEHRASKSIVSNNVLSIHRHSNSPTNSAVDTDTKPPPSSGCSPCIISATHTGIISRRQFLVGGSLALCSSGLDFGNRAAANTPDVLTPSKRVWSVGVTKSISTIEAAVLQDVRSLLQQAGIRLILLALEDAPKSLDLVVLLHGRDHRYIRSKWAMSNPQPGAFLIRSQRRSPYTIIVGSDVEGIRNGLYRWLRHLHFSFFRDYDSIPTFGENVKFPYVREELSPTFRRRGDMIWDFYLGPRRHCAAAWNKPDWERALLFMARNQMNFLEYYPPMVSIYRKSFPELVDLPDGDVWTAEKKLELNHWVLARGRSLGIQFMYVLNYGPFPAEVRKSNPQLEWAENYLCGHQKELRDMTARVWTAAVRELGTDHLYAIRHRGEEDQSYSDPCRSVSKVDGYRQAIDLLKEIDPKAWITLWSWAENIPSLFEQLPPEVRVAHIRHGMGGVFSDDPMGREQTSGRPTLPPEQHWIAGQFTVFGGNEAQVQSAWSDARAITEDARAAAKDPRCEGLFQWPEWCDTSPWLSYVFAQLSWNPAAFDTDIALQRYAVERHGTLADTWLHGYRPLFDAGNKRWMTTPRKRRLIAYVGSADEMDLLAKVRFGLEEMARSLIHTVEVAFLRDLRCLASWVAFRQAHVFEVAAYLRHVDGDSEASFRELQQAETTWRALLDILRSCDECSLLVTARQMAEEGELCAGAVDHFFTQACDFYGGYPLIESVEAVEWVYLEQFFAFRDQIGNAVEHGQVLALEEPGWFWSDFPDEAWREYVRLLPREDLVGFETRMKQALRLNFETGNLERKQAKIESQLEDSKKKQTIEAGVGAIDPRSLSSGDSTMLQLAIKSLIDQRLPPPLTTHPRKWPQIPAK